MLDGSFCFALRKAENFIQALFSEGTMGVYFGSVRFFKHLILATIVVLISGLSIGLAVSLVHGGRMAAEVQTLRAELDAAYETIRATEGAPDGGTEPEETGSALSQTADSLYYQTLYPDFYCEPADEFIVDGDSHFYISIDDGPSYHTNGILDVLAAHEVKATFFVVGVNISRYENELRRVAEEGHVIGMHSNSHELSDIYVSVEAFLDDFYICFKEIERVTGVTPTTFRFPGGSVNAYNGQIYQEIIAEMMRRGFTYYDWNVSAGDASSGANLSSARYAILNSFGEYTRSIALMHEKTFTAEMLDQIIPVIKEAGYDFRMLTNDVKPVIFGYPK